MPLLQAGDLLLQLLHRRGPGVVVPSEMLRAHYAGLLPQLSGVGAMLVPLVLRLRNHISLGGKLSIQVRELGLQRPMFLLHKLHLLTHMCDDLHRCHCLLPQLVQFLVSLFDLLVERLVLDLQLLEIDDVQVLRELVLLPQRLLQLRKPVLQRDVRATHLLHLGVLVQLELFDLLDDFVLDFLSVARVLGVPSYLPLELLERVPTLDGFLAFRLELVLQLLAHSGGFHLLKAELEANCVDVVEHVLILVLGHLAFRLLVRGLV
mmetsp:Transcript_30772/g.88880  ORF Transcript_30772/g.88880 Transcript_30772/m.88880 type:complete len:263 (-) Transcript_30772:276-1064(-)